LRSHDLGNHHLHAIKALVTAVIEFSLAFFGQIALKIRAGQILQKHVKTSIEQGLPALPQKAEELLFMS
jgi:hypothetical protein